MVVEEAAAIVDELQLLDDFVNDIPNPQKRIFPHSPNSILFDELLDSALDAIIPGLTPVKNPASNELNAEEEEELEWLSNKDAFPSLETSFESPPSTWSFRRKRSKIRRVSRELNEVIRPAYNSKRKCIHCEVEETPQWRIGPEGPKTLCNACGVRFKKGRLFPEYRPANSPKYSEGNYSNSTRRIMEMRMGTTKRGRPKMAADVKFSPGEL